MPFVLREEGSTENPPLAAVYGKQITAGKLAYYIKEGRTKCILILGEGEMDGIDKIYYNGEVLPEFNPTNASDRNWRFHPGTITTQVANYYDVVSISGTTLTLNSNPFTVGQAVAIVSGVDPETSPYPTGVKQHKKLYVVSSSGNNVQLSLTSGGSALSWTSSQYLLDNMKIYLATAGFFDPVQGRPDFFPTLDFTLSGIAYVEVNLPAAMSEIEEEPTKFKILVRGRRVQNYTNTGMLADKNGLAYDPLNLPSQTKFFSANNALVALDIILNYMKVEKTRIDWESWTVFRDYCDQQITWNSGSIKVLGNPATTMTSTITNPELGTYVKSSGTTGWNAGVLSTNNTTSIEDIVVSGVWRGGHGAIGLIRSTTIPVNYYSGLYSVYPNPTDGRIRIYKNGSSTPIFTSDSTISFASGDTFKIEVYQDTVYFYKNDTPFFTDTASFGAGTTRGYMTLNSIGASYSDFRFYPVTGASRTTNRFDAHVVFPQETDSSTALQQVMGRCPNVHWQDVNGKIKFIVGGNFADITLNQTPTAGQRVLADIFFYDPKNPYYTKETGAKGSSFTSNIIADSFSAYKTPPESKPNFLRLELRDLDDPFYTKKYVYNDRDALRDQAGTLVDFGVIPLGVATQSLADRLGEATMRWGADLDLFINLKTFGSTYAVSKGDIVKISHDIPNWEVINPGQFIVLEETIEPSTDTADEKSYLLQAYNPEFYSDTSHGAITANIPIAASPLTPPPAAVSLNLTEETRFLPDRTSYSTIIGRVVFNSEYPYTQRARIYWKKPLEAEFVATNIVLEQPNTGVTEIPFELNFATVGANEVKVVTETMTGVVSSNSLSETIEISGTVQIEEVAWEQFVNVQSIGGRPTKVAGVNGAWDASVKSNKAISFGDGYLQFPIEATNQAFCVGFNTYNMSNNSHIMQYAILINNTSVSVYINGSAVTMNGNQVPVAVGQSFKIEVTPTTVKFYQITSGQTRLIYEAAISTKYPIYVDTSIYETGDYIPPVQIYGNLETTTGLQLHWQSIRNVEITRVNGIEVLKKTNGNGWGGGESAGTFSAERLPRNGALEFVASETTTSRTIGLSEIDAELTNPVINGYEGIKYQIMMQASGVINFYEFGLLLGSSTYSTGDIFRMERQDAVVRVRKNGVLVFTFPTQSNKALYVDTAFLTANSTIKDPRLKRTGVFSTATYPYPIYLVTAVDVMENKPQEDGSTYFLLTGTFDTTNETVLRAKVRVFNKFGTLVADFPQFTYAGNGVIGQGFHDRKYADPFEEAIYEVRLDNGTGLSAPIYMQGTPTIPPVFNESFSMPTLLNEALAVQNLICASIDHTKVSLSWTYSGNIDIRYRQPGQAWAALANNISSKPFVVENLIPSTIYEFRAAPTGTTTNWSNICRTKTQQAPLPADVFPPPLSLVGSQNGAAPQSSIDLAWTRNSLNNTGVKIYRNNSLIYTGSSPTETNKTITGLSPSTSYTFKVRNVYAGGDSPDSNQVTVSTSAGDSPLKPSGLYLQVASSYQINVHWTNNTTAGFVEIWRRSPYDADFVLYNTVSATVNQYYDNGLEPNSYYEYKVKNTTVQGFSNSAGIYTWEWIEPPGCVTPYTYIWAVVEGQYVQKYAKDIKVGDEVLTILKNGVVSTTKINSVLYGKADSLHIITTQSGKTLECSASHPICGNLDLALVRAIDVTRGLTILTYEPSLEKVVEEVVESKEVLYGKFDVLIFGVEAKEHTFISSNIVSHNREEKPGDGPL